MDKIYFITSKKHKFEEAKGIIPYLEQKDIDLTEIQSMDVHKVIEHKLKEAKKHLKANIVVEDDSLLLEAFNGFPGPFARYLYESVNLSDLSRMIINSKKTKISFIGTIGLLYHGKEYFFEGRIDGNIVMPRGTGGFGFDPVNMPIGYDKTLAQMTLEEKNKLSHRGNAFRKLKEFLDKQ